VIWGNWDSYTSGGQSGFWPWRGYQDNLRR
jgi:hypothetical protein